MSAGRGPTFLTNFSQEEQQQRIIITHKTDSLQIRVGSTFEIDSKRGPISYRYRTISERILVGWCRRQSDDLLPVNDFGIRIPGVGRRSNSLSRAPSEIPKFESGSSLSAAIEGSWAWLGGGLLPTFEWGVWSVGWISWTGHKKALRDLVWSKNIFNLMYWMLPDLCDPSFKKILIIFIHTLVNENSGIWSVISTNLVYDSLIRSPIQSFG